MHTALFCTLVAACFGVYVCNAGAAPRQALPVDPIAWSTTDALNTYNKDAIFFYDFNQSVGKRWAATGDVAWYSAGLNTLVFGFTMAATSDAVGLYDNTALLGPWWWSFRTSDGAVTANHSVGFDCSNALEAADAWFACVGVNDTFGIVDVTGTMRWSNMESGLMLPPLVQQGSAPFLNAASTGAGGQVLFFTAASAVGTPVLVVVDPMDWSMLVLPNITATAPFAVNGVVFCLLADGAAGALDVATFAWLWQTAPSEALMPVVLLSPQLFIVGTVAVVVGCARTPEVCSIASFGLSSGGLLANTTFGAVQPLLTVAPAEGLLVVSYYNQTGTVTCRTFDPVSAAWVAYGALPGGTFTVVPPLATCGASLFGPNPQGYAHISAATLAALSYNLDLPHEARGQMVFPGVPSASHATVVMLSAFANATAVVLSC